MHSHCLFHLVNKIMNWTPSIIVYRVGEIGPLYAYMLKKVEIMVPYNIMHTSGNPIRPIMHTSKGN